MWTAIHSHSPKAIHQVTAAVRKRGWRRRAVKVSR
jgi:hypothetical protein